MATISKTKAIELLQSRISEVDRVKTAREQDFGEEFKKWHSSVLFTIRHVFPTDRQHLETFSAVRYTLSAFSTRTPRSEFHARYLEGLDQARGVLEAMVNEIREMWPEDKPAAASEVVSDPRKVFLVHGRDVAAQQSVARFLEKLGLEPVILAECPNGGRTIIEKFEQESNVGYAIALFTPDDVGGLRGGTEEQARARQNVVFELGYFVGKLGRSRVCVLNVSGVEFPSDFSGVAYVPFDTVSGDWKIGLVKELKAAGFDIDANKAFS